MLKQAISLLAEGFSFAYLVFVWGGVMIVTGVGSRIYGNEAQGDYALQVAWGAATCAIAIQLCQIIKREDLLRMLPASLASLIAALLIVAGMWIAMFLNAGLSTLFRGEYPPIISLAIVVGIEVVFVFAFIQAGGVRPIGFTPINLSSLVIAAVVGVIIMLWSARSEYPPKAALIISFLVGFVMVALLHSWKTLFLHAKT